MKSKPVFSFFRIFVLKKRLAAKNTGDFLSGITTYIVVISLNDSLQGIITLSLRTPLIEEEMSLLKAAETQIDSAMAQAQKVFVRIGFLTPDQHLAFQLSLKELDVIYRLDRVRDQNTILDVMLDSCVVEMLDMIEIADIACVLLHQYEIFSNKM